MQILNTFYGKSQQAIPPEGAFWNQEAATLHLNLKMRPVGVLLATMPEAIPPEGASWNQEGAFYGQEAAPFRTKRKFF